VADLYFIHVVSGNPFLIMHISNTVIASSTQLAGSVALSLTHFVLGLLVITIGIAVGIFFLYWAVRKAMRVHNQGTFQLGPVKTDYNVDIHI